jgi:hypothetical protein
MIVSLNSRGFTIDRIILRLLKVLAIQMQKSFVVYMAEILQVFNGDEMKEFQK